jgi:hypothetical protein
MTVVSDPFWYAGGTADWTASLQTSLLGALRPWFRAFRRSDPKLSASIRRMVVPEASEPEPAQARWFRELGQKIGEDYARLHRIAQEDVQRTGHEGEATWVNVLEHWLPPAYKVVTRKYIVPEIGNEEFETDIVVLNPSYPTRLHTDTHILAGGVAAAFSVKLTLDASGIRDGVKKAIALRRALNPRIGSPRDEVASHYPVGLLAHSHVWKLPGSTPAENISNSLWSLDQQLVRHPRESLDYLCVSDLATWTTSRLPWMPPAHVPTLPGNEIQKKEGAMYTTIMRTHPGEGFNALASLIGHLYIRLSYFDRTLLPLADNLRATGTLGGGGGLTRIWNLGDVYSDEVRRLLPSRGMQLRDSDWNSVIFLYALRLVLVAPALMCPRHARPGSSRRLSDKGRLYRHPPNRL